MKNQDRFFLVGREYAQSDEIVLGSGEAFDALHEVISRIDTTRWIKLRVVKGTKLHSGAMRHTRPASKKARSIRL